MGLCSSMNTKEEKLQLCKDSREMVKLCIKEGSFLEEQAKA
jgi:hypothetical protein